MLSEEALQELFDLICGNAPGIGFFFCGGITTYPNGDENSRKIYAGCIELEKRGLVCRRVVNSDVVQFNVNESTGGESDCG